MDILSVIAIHNQKLISGFLLAFICKTYIVSLIWVGYFGLIYAHYDFREKKEKQSRENGIYTVIVLVGTLLIYILPIEYYLEGDVVYTYGPSCIATYIFALLFVLVTLYKVLVKGREMNPKRRRAIIMWMCIWIVAAVIQFFNASLLLVGFASALGMVILFFELENPEANLDRETGAYNAHALGEYTKQLYEKQEGFSAILVALGNNAIAESDGSSQKTDRMLQDIASYADRIRNVKVFKTMERELVFITDDEKQMWEVLQDVKKHIHFLYAEAAPFYVVLPNSLLLGNVEEFFLMLRHYRIGRKKDYTENSIILDETQIGQYKERERTEAMLRSALEEDRIEVFYQPIYSTKQQRFVSAEALVRIRDQKGAIIPPGKFIPIAERNGLISRIGECVFEKTCAFIQKNHLKERYGIEYVEVNLSVRQCEDLELAETYIQIMEKYRLEPSSISLEITESASIKVRENLLENMRQLMDYGVRFALDDFGNGESNLNYIVDMPVSIVKFDKDMTQSYFSNYKAKFIMEAAMRMIQDMKLEIVSEGVETKEQAEVIGKLGIEYIQGYYFSKPLPGEEFLEFVAGKTY